MADPLSISASIAGLVTLADVVFLRLMKYVRSAKNAVKETEGLAREINLLGGALNSLSRLARSFDDEPIENKAFRMHHIEACSDILSNIDKKLKKFDGNSLKRKATWPFQSEHVKELLNDLSRHKQSVDLALSANSMELLLRSLAREEDLQKTTSEILANVEKTREITSRIYRNNEREKTLKFFLRYNPQQNYEMSLKLRHPRTGLWVLQLPKFQTWLSTAGEKLWFTGIPGAGKTVLAGTIIEAALARCDDHVAVAFFFCDYKDQTTHSPVNILGALAYQIAIQKEEAFLILEQYFRDLHPLRGLPRDPTVVGLERAIGQMIRLFPRISVIVDGIDECGKLVDGVLETLCSLSDDSDNISMALLSRDEADIRDRLEDDFFCEKVAAHTEDITEYVTAEIEERIRVGRLRIDDLELKGEIMQGLIDGAAGMFRWVACQLDHLQDCVSDKDCREALKKLPPDLNETYMRILERIPQNKTRLVQQILHFIAFAAPILNIKQLRELISVPDTGGFLEPSGLVRESSIQRLCSSLIRKSNDGERFEFAHFSVQEFLQNETLLRDQFEQFLISESRCNRLMTVQCLRYIQLENFNHYPVARGDELRYLMKTRAEKYPLYAYAAFWPRYAKCEWADKEVIKCAEQLFNYRKTALFTSWSTVLVIRLHADSYYLDDDLDHVMASFMDSITKVIDEDFTPLHMACLLWLPEICSYLMERGADINHESPVGRPIQCAAGGIILLTRNRIFNYISPKGVVLPAAATRVLRCLLEAGENHLRITSCFRQPESPLSLAISSSKFTFDFSAVAFLLSEGIPLEKSDVEECSVAIEECDKLRVYDSSLELLIKTLNSMLDRSHLHRQLCSRLWALAVRQGRRFASNPDFVDPSISLTQDAQRLRIIKAVEDDDTSALKTILKSSGLNPPDITDSEGRPLLHIALDHHELHNDHITVIGILLQTGCSFSQPDSEGYPPVHRWLTTGKSMERHYDEPFIKALIDLGVNIDAQDGEGSNLLHLSIHDPQCLSALLKYGKEASITLAIRTMDHDGYTPLSKALGEAHTASALLLLKRNGNDPETWRSPISVLNLAARVGCEDIFRALMAAGETIFESESEISTPLHYLGATPSLDFVNYLKSLYPEACNIRVNGKIPLDTYLEQLFKQRFEHQPSSMDPEVVSALYPVESQCDEGKLVWEEFVKVARRFGNSAATLCSGAVTELMRLGCLAWYETASRKSALWLVVEATRDLQELRDLSPFTPRIIYDIAISTDRWMEFPSSPSIVKLLKAATVSNNSGLVKLLLHKGVSVHQRVGDSSALEVACSGRVRGQVFRLILDYAEKGRLDERNPALSGNGLIHRLSVRNANSKLIELLQRGADPNLRVGIPPYDTALIHHLGRGHIQSSITLLEQGADPTIVNENNCDACYVATCQGDIDFLVRVYEMTTSSWQPAWKRVVHPPIRIGSEEAAIFGCNALHLAALYGQADCLRFYVDRNIFSDVNVTSNDMFMPLHCAALHGHVDVINYLHRQRANINARTTQGHSPLHFAVLNQNLGAVETLLKLGSEVAVDKSGMNPYQYACQDGCMPIIDSFHKWGYQHILLSSNVTKGKMVSSTKQQLSLAMRLESAIRSGDIALRKKVHQEGCQLNVDLPSCQGCSPLLLAIRQEKPKIVKWLLDHGASTLKPSCQRCGGQSPIYEMLKYRGLTMVLREFLEKYLDDGGNPLEESSSPVYVAVSHVNAEGLHILLDHLQHNAQHYAQMLGIRPEEVVSMAVNKRVNLPPNRSPLHLAAFHGHLEIAECLIENGANVNASAQQLRTPLHNATFSEANDIHKMIEVLISHGADLECRDENGVTPLMIASHQGRLDLVKILLGAGANPKSTDWFSNTALSVLVYVHPSTPGHKAVFAYFSALGLNPHLENSDGLSAMQLAMGEDQFASLILNGDYEVQETRPFPWGLPRPVRMSWLTTKFPMFRRKIPLGDLSRIANTEPSGCWSPLCLSACQGSLTMIENLLTLGANMEFEGCPEGTALMAACVAGMLDSVIFLVRRGASLSYHGPNGFRTALDKSKTPKHILQWLLVTRFTDQGKIRDTPGDSSSSVPRPWSGILKAELVICERLERRPDQSSKDYWIYLMGEKERWRGKVVPVGDRRKTVRPSKLIPVERVRIHPDGYEVHKPAGFPIDARS